ncbi:MAG: DNA-binding transcriptional regulator [Ilumatobacter coccineus]|uniref:DNA-binding transcriptional regulator n=1 Tax=Ilumatobacter coccineus TaxID=467094 RepID=A0A2G6KG16_9ACTN|nr:MAG: DNA-binding transcriptional regulator [Ilumatobacter coccineus]
MADSQGPTARALQLLSLLHAQPQWSGHDLAERLGVTTRTLRRHIDRLRSLGYPVQGVAGADGGYRLGEGGRVLPLLITDDEAIALAVALRLVAGTPVRGMADAGVTALAQLDSVLPDRLRHQVTALADSIALPAWSFTEREVDPDLLSVMARACRDGEELRFAYIAADGEKTDRLTQPHRVVVVRDRWYLVAWDLRRDDWRTFRLDRASDARFAGVRFKPKEIPGGDPVAFVTERQAPGTEFEAEVILGPGVDRSAVCRLGLIEERDGRLTLSLRAHRAEWLINELLVVIAELDVVGLRVSDEIRVRLREVVTTIDRLA